MVLKLIAGSALTTDSVEVSSSSSRLVIHHGAELEHPCCPAVATNHGVRSLRDAEEEKCLMRSWQSRTFFIPLFFLLNPPSPSPHLVQSRRLLLQLLRRAEGLVDIGRKLLHLVVHQQLLNKVTGGLAADGVDLTVDDGDDLCQRQTDCRQTIRSTAGGRVTWRRAEELGQVVTETGETSVQTGFEDSGEVWTIQHVSSLVKQLYGHNVILCKPARLIGQHVLVICKQVPGQRPPRAGLHLRSDPVQLLLQLQQRPGLLQRHASQWALYRLLHYCYQLCQTVSQ